MWESIIQPAIDDLQTDVQKLIDDIQKAFGNSDSSVSITDALTVIGQDLAVTILDVIKNIVDGLVKLIAQLLKWLADVGNATINIPVFSALYREITDGHELTAFDAICLVIAVPTTLLAKAVTGNALPDISKSLDTNAFDQYVKGNDPLGMNQIAAYGCVSAGIIGIAIGLVGFALDNIDPVSAMAVTSKSTQPRMRLGAIGADVISGYDLCNLVTGLCNTLLAVPSQKTLDKVGEDSVVWGMWSLMAYRWILAGLLYGINKSGAKPTPGAKVGIAGFNILGAAAQYGLQIYVSHKMGGGSENEGRRDAIATCYFVGAACRAATTIAAVAEQPEVEVVTGALFCYAALGSVGLQLWNVESTKNGGWWDSMPTVA